MPCTFHHVPFPDLKGSTLFPSRGKAVSISEDPSCQLVRHDLLIQVIQVLKSWALAVRRGEKKYKVTLYYEPVTQNLNQTLQEGSKGNVGHYW